MKKEIEREGSFRIESVEIIALPWAGVIRDDGDGEEKTIMSYNRRRRTTQQMAKAIRAVNESMIRNHFGGDVIEPLFQKFGEIMEADTREVEHVSLVLSLVRKTINDDGEVSSFDLK